MTTTARLDITVTSSGVEKAQADLDKLSQSSAKAEQGAKNVEAATTRTDRATAAYSDRVSRAITQNENLSRTHGAIEAAARRAGVSYDEMSGRIANASANVGRYTQAAAGASAASRTMAAEKSAVAVSAGNLSAALNVARPAVVNFGGALGQLPAVAAAARFGIGGVATSLTGGLVVSLAKAADEIANARNRLGAITGDFAIGAAAADRMRDSADRGGASVASMSGAFERLFSVLRNPPSEPGVIRIGANAEESARKVTNAIDAINAAMRRAHVPTDEIEKGLRTYAQNVDQLGRLTGEGLRKISAEVPEFGRVLAQGLSGGLRDAQEQAKFLDTLPATIDRVTAAAKTYNAQLDRAFDPNRAKTVAESMTEISRAWDSVVKSLADAGVFSFVAKELSALASDIRNTKAEIEGIPDAARNAAKTARETFSQIGGGRDTENLGLKDRAAINAVLRDSAQGMNEVETAMRKADSTAEQYQSHLQDLSQVTSTLGTNTATALASFETAPAVFGAVSEASAGFAAVATEQFNNVTIVYGNTATAADQFAQNTTSSMTAAAGSAEASAQRIVAAMQAIIDAANQAAAAQAQATGGYGGTGSSPYAKGGAFSGGVEIKAFALGGVVTGPTTFPMADGMGLMGEAGPEAVMPLARTSDGSLGVKTTSSAETSDISPLVPTNPTVVIVQAIEDQTTELRSALTGLGITLGGSFEKSISRITSMIGSSQITVGGLSSVGSSTGATMPSYGGSFASFDTRGSGGFPDTGTGLSAPRSAFGTSVQSSGSGGQTYTSSSSVTGMGGSFGAQPSGGLSSGSGGGGGLRTSVQTASSSGSSSSSGGNSPFTPFTSTWFDDESKRISDNVNRAMQAAAQQFAQVQADAARNYAAAEAERDRSPTGTAQLPGTGGGLTSTGETAKITAGSTRGSGTAAGGSAPISFGSGDYRMAGTSGGIYNAPLTSTSGQDYTYGGKTYAGGIMDVRSSPFLPNSSSPLNMFGYTPGGDLKQPLGETTSALDDLRRSLDKSTSATDSQAGTMRDAARSFDSARSAFTDMQTTGFGPGATVGGGTPFQPDYRVGAASGGGSGSRSSSGGGGGILNAPRTSTANQPYEMGGRTYHGGIQDVPGAGGSFPATMNVDSWGMGSQPYDTYGYVPGGYGPDGMVPFNTGGVDLPNSYDLPIDIGNAGWDTPGPTYGPADYNTGGYTDIGGYGGEVYQGGDYAAGGSFTMPGVGAADSVKMIAHVSPGEHVEFTPPGRKRGGSGGGDISIGEISLHGITRPSEWLENEEMVKQQIAQTVKDGFEAR